MELYKVDNEKTYVHPKFNGDPCCGYDIAIGPVVKQKHEYSCMSKLKPTSSIDCFWGQADPKTIWKGMKVEIAGYPGEKNWYPHHHCGQIVGVEETALGGWILFYDVDTTLGNSGSLIYLTDETWIKKYILESQRKEGCKKVTIGIHTGHDYTNMENFGTLITPALFKWVVKNKE